MQTVYIATIRFVACSAGWPHNSSPLMASSLRTQARMTILPVNDNLSSDRLVTRSPRPVEFFRYSFDT